MYTETSPNSSSAQQPPNDNLPRVSGGSTDSSTDKVFEDILNQLQALGNTIDQELSSSSSTPSKVSNKNYQTVDDNNDNNKNNEQNTIMVVGSNYNHIGGVSSNANHNPSSPMKSAGTNGTTYYASQPSPSSSSSSPSSYYPPEPVINKSPMIGSCDSNNNNGGKPYHGYGGEQTETSPEHHQSPYHMHHSIHHHHHYQSYPTETNQVLDNSGHDPGLDHPHHHLMMPPVVTQIRTDSPDNDSAFSDSISLISSEQSSSSGGKSSSNGGTTNGSSSGQSSQSVNSSSSSSTSSDDNNNNNNGTNVTNTQQKSTPGSSSIDHHHHHYPSTDSAVVTDLPQQQLFFEQPNEKKNDDDNDDSKSPVTIDDDFDDLCSKILNGMDLQFEITDRTSIINHSDGDDDDNRTLNGDTVDHGQDLDVGPGDDDNVHNHQNDSINEIDEKIRLAMEKIREANFRKLYLKVFAEDNSTKCLLADERMPVGAICQRMAHKNHIGVMGLNYCIMEHMPQLYLERFYEDHESLVQNVLYWGREHTNKLYFVQQPDKYDVFVQPEKYLISISKPNENIDTLKSGSLRAKYNANQLRTDLIEQFFSINSSSTTSSTTTSVRVPEIEGNLYLRSEGKKQWKKYFFTLRSSGLYYCLKGKPKSTKDLINLTTFELNCVYYGFGWKKKFKAPNDFGFAIKHPQIQQKSPKHIKYLCAETLDDLKLWMTGIRIAKYGRQLFDNYQQFKSSTTNTMNGNGTDEIDSGSAGGGSIIHDPNKKITTFSLPSDSDHGNYGYRPSDDSPQYGGGGPGSITMRSNRIARSGSVRSSSASSSSGCMSEQSSLVSTPSSSGPSPGAPDVHAHSNYHHTTVMASPSHNHLHPATMTPSAFEADFPVGTIKRKPNVMIQPKIPLTNTTRNLAMQSDDALLEVNDGGNGGVHADDIADQCCMGNQTIGGSPQHNEFQRGTFKSGTLRRSNTADTAKPKPPPMMSPQHHHHQIYQSMKINNNHHPVDDDDDLPPPPPPPPTLKEAESTLSLNASFPPPPPPEILNGGTPESPIPVPEMPMKPPSMSALPLPPMTPQPQIKNRLARRLSDLSENSTLYSSFRNNYETTPTNNNGYSLMFSPNSRASIASSADSTSFVTIKSNNNYGRRFQRHNSIDHHHLQQQYGPWNKYGTSPRVRGFEQEPPFVYNRPQPPSGSQQQPNQNGNYAAFSPPLPPPPPPHGSGSHCAIIGDGSPSRDQQQYDFPPSRVKVFAPFQPSSGGGLAAPQTMPPPPPVMENGVKSQRPTENHYMSISPHLIQKHQQMIQQQQKLANQQSPGTIYSTGGQNPSMSYHVPEDLFLKNMERVMQKKWHVAQMLRKDNSGATPGQVLGFRDSAYLPPEQDGQMPPPPPPPASMMMMNPVTNNSPSNYGTYGQFNGHSPAHHQVHHHHHNHQFPAPGPIPVLQSSTPTSPYHSGNAPGSPYHHYHHHPQKTVQFTEAQIHNSPESNMTMMMMPGTPVHHQSSSPYLMDGGQQNRKIPPPPPKRSESTQLTTGPTGGPSRR